jgi:hypothetical protein
MEPDEQQLEAWEDSVPLGNAWWNFAGRENKNLFREQRREGRGIHLRIRYNLEVDLIARLEDGQLEAYGIEEGSNSGPIRIAQYYFSKTAKVDYHDDTVTALGKKFYEVRVQEAREPPPVNLRQISARRQRQRLDDTLPSESSLRSESNEVSDRSEREPVPVRPSSDASPTREPGRPSKSAEIERAIEILVANGGTLAKMPRTKAYRAVRECAARALNSDTQIGFSDPVIQRALLNHFGPRR